MHGRIPKLCRHKATRRAYVTDPYTHKPVYLGAWGSKEAEANYEAWVTQFLARRKEVASGAPVGANVSVAQLVLDYLAHARTYYRKGGKVTSEVDALESALYPVALLFGEGDVNAFSPTNLKAVRQWMVEKGWARDSINKQVQRVRRVWKWGVEHELVKPDVLAALQAVQGLAKGRTAAPETEPVGPVPPELVEATLPRLAPDVAALVRVQWYAGMRPGEVVIMRAGDIDQLSRPWLYVPGSHKTEHRGKTRKIWLGPKAREALLPLLGRVRSPDAWLFPSHARGKHAASRTHWTVGGYREAIRRACEEIDPPLPAWNPNQLRHAQATAIRSAHGIEAAQVILGHSEIATSELYAEKDETLARQVAEEIG